jgi:putative addiction module CopG family antidote
MPARNVSLTDELDRFVAKKVKTGRYENASEVVRAGLRVWSARNSSTKRSLRRCERPSTKATPAVSPRVTYLGASVRPSSFPRRRANRGFRFAARRYPTIPR